MTAIFRDDLAAEQQSTLRPELRDTLRNLFPAASGYTVVRGLKEQKAGIDARVNMLDGSFVTTFYL